MTMIRLGITTAPRPGKTYLWATIASLEHAGFCPPFLIFAEPHSPLDADLLANHIPVQRPKKLGEWQNWIEGFRMLTRMPGDARSLVMVQDDLIFCRRVRELLERRLWPSERCGAIQLYTSHQYRAQKDFPRGLSILPRRFLRELNSACAIAFRPSVAIEILEYAEREPWRGRRLLASLASEVQELDSFIGTALLELDREIWCCNPSLGFHIGEVSAFAGPNHGGSQGPRQALDFPGENADAIAVIE